MLVGVRVGEGGVSAIIERFGVSARAVESMNGMALESVRKGMILLIPIEDDIVHVVRPFESVESIARAYGVTPEYIREYNDVERVFLGDKIYIEKDKK